MNESQPVSDRDIMKQAAIKATKKMHGLIKRLTETTEPQLEALEEFQNELQSFLLMVSGHPTSSPWVSAWEKFYEGMKKGLTKQVRVALLIRAMREECPEMPRLSSSVPQAILQEVFDGVDIRDPIIRHKVKAILGEDRNEKPSLI